MLKRLALIAATVAGFGQPALGQPSRSIGVEQIPAPRLAATIRVQAIRGGSSSSSAARPPEPEVNARPAVSQEVIEACQTAQREDRRAPEGINCSEVLENFADAVPEPTAEGALLGLLGQRSNITGVNSSRTADATNADAVARQISTGDVQAGSGAAAVVARGRTAPPPNPSQ